MGNTFYRILDQIFFSQHVAILMYHGFTDQEDPINNYHGKHLHIKRFREHLLYLKKYFHILSLNQWLDHYRSKSPFPKNSVILTIDDGYESNYTLAFNLLKEFNAPATIFLTTDFIEHKQFLWPSRVEHSILHSQSNTLNLNLNGQEIKCAIDTFENKKNAIDVVKSTLKIMPHDKVLETVNYLEELLKERLCFTRHAGLNHPLNWQQIGEMLKSGLITFGNHTCSHPMLKHAQENNMREEIMQSKKIIENRLNTPCNLFCFPFGDKNSFTPQIIGILQENGFICGLTTLSGKNTQDTNPFYLKRIGTSNLVDTDNFTNSLSSSYKFFGRYFRNT